MVIRFMVLVVAVFLAAAPVQAADPVFPLGSRIGLVPPPGLVQSRTFEGFEDADKKVAIVVIELAPTAYADIEKQFDPETLKAQGTEVDLRESITVKDGHGFIVSARQVMAGTKLRKWILIAVTGQLTALISAQVPEAAAATYPDDTIRAALATVAIRTSVPDAEQLSVLPFKIRDLAGFRLVRASPSGVALLTDGPKNGIELNEQPLLLISLGPGAPDQPEERHSFARRVISTTPGVKDMQITRAEPLRIGGQPGEEMIVEAKDTKSGAALTLVQWLRFGSGGFVRLLCMTRSDTWDQMFPRFRAVRDGIDPK
jgi:hypothetical protein